MNQESELMICTIKAAVTGKPCLFSGAVDWNAFLTLAKKHCVVPLVWYGLKNTPELLKQLPENMQALFSQVYLQAICRDARADYLRQQLTQELNRLEVPHVYLKGAVIKACYPVPALRTMADMDLLVYAEDFDKIRKIALSLGGAPCEGDGNHRNYLFPGWGIIEFHPNMLHHASHIAPGLNPGWQYADECEDSFEQKLTPEGLYLNILSHMAHHFAGGGVGVRFVLDVWVYRHFYKPQPNPVILEAELKKYKLWKFAQKIEQLSEAWFGDERATEDLEEVEEYILSSGVHGFTQRGVLNDMCLSKGQSRSSAMLSRMFYPRKELEDRFLWTRGRPWLLPAAWCVRAWQAVTIHGFHIHKWLHESGKISKQEVQAQREKLERMGIQLPDNTGK